MQTKLPVIALVDMEAFLASVEQALNPELAGKPVIIGGLPGTRGIVICASYEARQLGVKFGMTLAEAYRTLPQAVFIKGDIKIYRELWGKICDIFAAYTPLVEPVSMDEAYLDLTDSIPSRGSIENLSQSLKNNIKQQLNVNCRIGVGSSKLFAKIACGQAKQKKLAGLEPIAIISPDDEGHVLDNLPVSDLPNVGHKTEKLLNELGVSTIAQMRTVPRRILEQLFGKRGLEWYDYSRGVDKRAIRASLIPKTISRETSFNADSTDRKFLMGTLYYLLERVCLELRRRALQTRRLTVKIQYVDYQMIDQAVSLDYPGDCEMEMFPQAARLFNELYSRKVGVRHVGVAASRLCPALKQENLFGRNLERQRNLNAGLDRVRNHFGYHAIFYGKTMPLKDKFREVSDGYELRTPSLSL